MRAHNYAVEVQSCDYIFFFFLVVIDFFHVYSLWLYCTVAVHVGAGEMMLLVYAPISL